MSGFINKNPKVSIIVPLYNTKKLSSLGGILELKEKREPRRVAAQATIP